MQWRKTNSLQTIGTLSTGSWCFPEIHEKDLNRESEEERNKKIKEVWVSGWGQEELEVLFTEIRNTIVTHPCVWKVLPHLDCYFLSFLLNLLGCPTALPFLKSPNQVHIFYSLTSSFYLQLTELDPGNDSSQCFVTTNSRAGSMHVYL